MLHIRPLSPTDSLLALTELLHRGCARLGDLPVGVGAVVRPDLPQRGDEQAGGWRHATAHAVSRGLAATLLATAVMATAPSLADEPTTHYSKGSAALVRQESADGSTDGNDARFVGRVRLEGKLVVEFERLPNQQNPEDTVGEAFFVPDARSRKQLPAAIGRYYPRPVDFIALDKKPGELLTQLVGRPQTEQILQGRMPRYEVPATLTIQSFSSWIACDRRGYTAEVASIAGTRPHAVAEQEAQFLSC